MTQPARRSLQASPIGTCSSWSIFSAVTTGKRHSVAPAGQPDGPSVQTPYDSSSLSLCFAPPTLASHSSHRLPFTGVSRQVARCPTCPRPTRAGQWWPPSTSAPAGRPSAALVTSTSRRSMAFSALSAALEAAASADGCGAPEGLVAVQGRPQRPYTLGGRLEDGWVGAWPHI